MKNNFSILFVPLQQGGMEVNMKLGEYLVQNNLITSDQLNQALELQKTRPDQKIGEILVELGYLSPDNLQKAIEGNTA